MVFASVRRSGRLLALDTGHETGSVAGEILARVSSKCWSDLKSAPQRIAMPDYPEGTSPALTKNYHPRAEVIVERVGMMLGKQIDASPLIRQRLYPNDVPGDWFTGPF
jgi:pyruvate dehydrogenase E1 component beta subunit